MDEYPSRLFPQIRLLLSSARKLVAMEKVVMAQENLLKNLKQHANLKHLQRERAEKCLLSGRSLRIPILIFKEPGIVVNLLNLSGFLYSDSSFRSSSSVNLLASCR